MLKRLMWYWKTDRLGPDILSTHFLLYFKSTARWICKKKFKQFESGAEFRPHALANCTKNISIGKNVFIRPGTMLYADDTQMGQIIIEDDVGIGAGVHMYVNNHRYTDTRVPVKYQGYDKVAPVRVCHGAWIGACAVLLAGITVGENAVVGAGAIVTKDVPPFTLVAGNPAKKIRDIHPNDEPNIRVIGNLKLYQGDKNQCLQQKNN